MNNSQHPRDQVMSLIPTFALALACALFAGGCSSTPASASFASVTIANRSLAQIHQTAAAVFAENGYQMFNSGDTLIFDKEGSRANTIARDGLIAAQSGASTIVRVRAQVVDLGAGSHRLQCQAYMVTGAGDSFFEEEHRLANFRRGPYQSILDEVGKRLQPASDPKP